MERHTDTADLPEGATMDSKSESSGNPKTFTCAQIPEIVELFKEADVDGGGGLDIDEFCNGLKHIFGGVGRDELTVLFSKIDTNCDESVDLCELLDYILQKNKASNEMDFDGKIFSTQYEIISLGHNKPIIEMIFRPDLKNKVSEYQDPPGQHRPYKNGDYISVSTDGILTFWPVNLDTSHTILLNEKLESNEVLPFSHKRKMSVNGMVYIKELQQLAVATTERELLFFQCNEIDELFVISHSIIVEDDMVSALQYWSNKNKSVFAFGDVKGTLFAFVSNNMEEYGLLNAQAYEKVSLRRYPTVYASRLIKAWTDNFQSVAVSVFNDLCTQIRYFPELDSLAVCGSSSKRLGLVALPNTLTNAFVEKVFFAGAEKDFFNCVEFVPSTGHLVTGCKDSLIREWYPHKTSACKRTFKGHVSSITHIIFNPLEKVFLSFSEDKNICMWSEELILKQSFQVEGMGLTPITCVCYNTLNNELILANTILRKCLGKGTDIYYNALTSHDKPVCSALYHNFFKVVISVCQMGMVTVWDITTGKRIMQFNVTSDQHVKDITIAFDGPQRRLITAFEGKVKLWNFNNGRLLALLPVKVQREVTSVVCIGRRIFVAGRDSKIIYNLDIDCSDNKYLEHDYLTDISSMDVHTDTLVAAASNGNIVVWDIASAQAYSYVIGSESPRIHMADKRTQGRIRNVPAVKNVMGTGKCPPCRKSETATQTAVNISPLTICLKTREINFNTATLLTSADGYIYAWSVKIKGGLLGKFWSVKKKGAVITAMSTDVNEQILLTGDSHGNIYQWDIREFGFKKQNDIGPFENIKGWRVSLCPPPLLYSWQSQFTRVVSIHFGPAGKTLITAGSCNIWLWENTGSYIGLLGKDYWDAQFKLKNDDQEEAGRSVQSAKARKSKKKIFETKPTTPPSPPVPHYQDILQSVGSYARSEISMTEETLEAARRKLIKLTAGPDVMSKKCQQKVTQQSSTEGGTELKQSSLKTAYPLNQTMSAHGRQFKIKQRDTLNDSSLTPLPPNNLPAMKTAQHVTPISDGVQLTTGCTNSTKSTPQFSRRRH